MSKFLLFVLTITLNFFAFSQNTTVVHTLPFTVLDSETKEPIPYATIYSHATGTGTVTNLKGQFNWDSLTSNDTLRLSFVGFESQIFTSNHPIPTVIYLKPKIEVLQSAYVYGNMSFLYALVSGCKESRSNRTKPAKTYLSLASIIKGQTIERMEAYYNGYFSGYDCQELKLKTGRLAISNFGDRFFISTETTKALYLHQLFNSDSYFPTGPMGLNKKKLSKWFTLQFVKSYQDDNQHTVYQINYTPNKECEDCFHGTLWVDSLQHQIQRITLFTNNTKQHPFIPLGNSDSLLNVSLEITKNYTTTQSHVQFKSTDFNYQLVYKTRTDSVFTVNTNALVYAFDHQTQFDLPHFEYGNISYQDYILIGSIPYNASFWQNYKEFHMINSQETSKLFQSLHPEQTGTFVNTTHRNFKKPFFEHAYKPWSIKRIQLNHVLDEKVKGSVPLEAPPSQQYHLETQIYLDVNEFNDSIHVITKSYFDPYDSFFYLPQTSNTDAFVNMYFDLTEIKRRELIILTQKATSKSQVEAIYQKCMTDLKEEHKTFVKETQRGYKLNGMTEWNEYIYRHLRIDNMELFHLLENP